MTEYELGRRAIQAWLAEAHAEDIPWKIRVCLDNYPDDPRYRPYYDAMLEALRQRQEERGQDVSGLHPGNMVIIQEDPHCPQLAGLHALYQGTNDEGHAIIQIGTVGATVPITCLAPLAEQHLCADCGRPFWRAVGTETQHCEGCQAQAAEEETFDPAEVVTEGDIADWSDPERESGLEWDTGVDVAPARGRIARLGNNPWVTGDLGDPWPGEEGIYFPEQQWADQTPPMICPDGHAASFKPSVGTHICPTCGAIYLPRQGEWSAKNR